MSPVNYGFLNVEDCQKYDFDSATSRDMRLCKTKVTLAYYFLLLSLNPSRPVHF